MTTNEDFVVVVGSDTSVGYREAKLIHVGDNLAGHEFVQGTGRVIRGVKFCTYHTSTDNYQLLELLVSHKPFKCSAKRAAIVYNV